MVELTALVVVDVNPMKTTTTLMVGLMLLLSLAAMTPTASAHYCSSTDGNCNQPCDEDEDHDHYWRDSQGRYQECHSDVEEPTEPGPTELPTPCDIYWLVYEIFDESVDFDIRDTGCAFEQIELATADAAAFSAVPSAGFVLA